MTPMSSAALFIVNLIFSLYIFVLMLRILLELVQADYYHPVCQFILKLTDGPLRPLQRILPRVRLFDFPALVLLIVVEAVKLILFSLIMAGFPNIIGLVLWVVSDLIKELINLYFYMIILFAILSWIANAKTGPLALILFRLVDPLLRDARRLLPHIGGIDFSPLLVLIVMQLANILLVMPVLDYAMSLSFGA